MGLPPDWKTTLKLKFLLTFWTKCTNSDSLTLNSHMKIQKGPTIVKTSPKPLIVLMPNNSPPLLMLSFFYCNHLILIRSRLCIENTGNKVWHLRYNLLSCTFAIQAFNIRGFSYFQTWKTANSERKLLFFPYFGLKITVTYLLGR